MGTSAPSPAAAAAASPSIYEAVVALLRQQRVLFHEEPERSRVRFEYASPTGAWTTYAVAFEEERQLAVYGVVPVPADPPQLPALAELITRINFGLVIGNFELDYDGGEIRCKTSVDLEDVPAFAPVLADEAAAQDRDAAAAEVADDGTAVAGPPAFAALARQLLRANLALMEHHLPAFVAAVIHSRPVAEALALLAAAAPGAESAPDSAPAGDVGPGLAEALAGFRDAANP